MVLLWATHTQRGNSIQNALCGARCVPQGLVYPLLDLKLYLDRDLFRPSVIRDGPYPLRFLQKQLPASLIAIRVIVSPVDVQLNLGRDARDQVGLLQNLLGPLKPARSRRQGPHPRRGTAQADLGPATTRCR
jgi:hypothetical protein